MTDVSPRALSAADLLEATEGAFQMDEAAFTVFYQQTSRPLWVFLTRACGDPLLADDLLQDAYYRVLRSGTTFESDDHRRHYLFRVAANLVRDHRRRPAVTRQVTSACEMDRLDERTTHGAERAAAKIDLERALSRLSTRERGLVRDAYVEGASHAELAVRHGLTRGSLRVLLHRARRKLHVLLGGGPDDTGRAR
jgi:RNA polymerase sigma-70 factor, ECF subfamily